MWREVVWLDCSIVFMSVLQSIFFILLLIDHGFYMMSWSLHQTHINSSLQLIYYLLTVIFVKTHQTCPSFYSFTHPPPSLFFRERSATILNVCLEHLEWIYHLITDHSQEKHEKEQKVEQFLMGGSVESLLILLYFYFTLEFLRPNQTRPG